MITETFSLMRFFRIIELELEFINTVPLHGTFIFDPTQRDF